MISDKDLQKDMEFLLDIFTGADGGIGFVKFRSAIEDFNKQAENGDEASIKLLKMFKDFVKLSKIVTK